jgi:DNA helicase-2/ATP-dependent DNA helicase PcrA
MIQKEAIEATEGPVLIIAGAGTGKTYVVTEKICHLVIEKGVDPKNILALAFSNKAAEEMALRVEKSIGSATDEMSISTIHSFCSSILRESGLHIGIPSDFNVSHEVEQWMFLRGLLPELKLDYYLQLADPGAVIGDFTHFINRAKDELISPTDYKEYALKCQKSYEERSAELAEKKREAEGLEVKRKLEIADIYETYQKRMIKSGNLDFGDLIVCSYELFKERPNVLREYEERFKYILVDEFQDTNIAQIELLHLLAENHKNITVVGDDDQSIYRFRGASYASFVNFKKKFPETKEIQLIQNYRSTKTILESANRLIACNAEARYAPDKDLWTENPRGDKLTILVSPDFRSEVRVIADTIEEEVKNGLDHTQIAVLYRAHANKDMLVKEMERRGIPFAVRAQDRLFETDEIRDLISYLRVIGDFEDSVSIFRILSHPKWGLSGIDLSRLGSYARRKRISLFETIQRIDEAEHISEEKKERIKKFHGMMVRLTDQAHTKNASEMFQAMLLETGYLSELIADSSPESEQKALNVSKLYRFINQFCDNNPNPMSGAFLEYFELYLEAGGDPGTEETEADSCGVNLLTVHGVKGLEFDTVFVIGLTRNRFPTGRRGVVVEFPVDLMREAVPGGDVLMQEERRLFYVAMTRAKRKLYLSAVNNRHNPISPFIEEVAPHENDELTERIAIEPTEKIMEKIDVPLDRLEVESVKTKREILNVLNDLMGRDQVRLTADVFREDIRDLVEAYWQLVLLKTVRAESQPAKVADLNEHVLPDLLRSLKDIEFKRVLREGEQLLLKPFKEKTFPTDEKPRLSFTQIDMYSRCPLRYKFVYIYRIPRAKRGALEFGSNVHSVLEDFYRAIQHGREVDLEYLYELYEKHWTSDGYSDEMQEREYKKSGFDQLKEYYEKNKDELKPPLYVEKRFHLRMESCSVAGLIDRVDVLEDDNVEIIDYKTGKTKGKSFANKSLQLSIYALATKEVFKKDPIVLSFYYLANNKKVSSARTDEQLEETKQLIVDTARKITNREFPRTPAWHCRWCEYGWLCEKERQTIQTG